ncbi:hypothetical protein D3C87_123370 [compost metagenome]
MTEENRIIELETKIAHQDVLLEELSQVLYQQQQQIDLMETKLTGLIKRIQDGNLNGTDVREGSEKPPHY